MESHVQAIDPKPPSKRMLWTGRILAALIVLFLLFDGITKVIKVPQVIEASGKFGYSANTIVEIGIIVLACTIIYAIPPTEVFGALLLTGYLGGAVESQVRVNAPLFETLFPVMFGVLVWMGLVLRNGRLRAFLFSR